MENNPFWTHIILNDNYRLMLSFSFNSEQSHLEVPGQLTFNKSPGADVTWSPHHPQAPQV